MEVLDHVPHRTTYRQNNSWVVHEIPAEWLSVCCETKRPAGAISRDCRACARNICQEPSEVDISSTCKVGQKLGVSLPLLTCSPSAWPSRLLYLRGRKSRRDLWITLYYKLLLFTELFFSGQHRLLLFGTYIRNFWSIISFGLMYHFDIWVSTDGVNYEDQYVVCDVV